MSYIPSKNIEMFPEARINYDPISQPMIKFFLPSYLGFVNPKDCKLSYTLQMSGRGYPQPNKRAGCHSLVRDIRIMDGTSQTILENIQDYNALVSTWFGYTENRSILNQRTTYEGVSMTPEVGSSLYYNNDNEDWRGAIGTVVVNKSKPVQMLAPLYTGILNNDSVFPIMATNGLRMSLQLDNVSRSLNYLNEGGVIQRSNQVDFKAICMRSASSSPAPAVPPAADNHVRTADTTTFTWDVKLKGDPSLPAGSYGTNNSDGFNNCPFVLGDLVYFAPPATVVADFEIGNPANMLGYILKMEKHTSAGPPATDYLRLTLSRNVAVAPAPPGADDCLRQIDVNSYLYVLESDRVNGYTPVGYPAGGFLGDLAVNDYLTLAESRINYTITDLKYLIQTVSPPPNMVNELQRQIQSEKGFAYDIKTYDLQRVNLSATNGLTNQFIPCILPRAYSIISLPLSQNLQNNVAYDSFQGLIDGCQNYQYMLGTNTIPNRPIKLTRYSKSPSFPDALALVESEKCLVNCGFACRNLQRMPDRFFIGRAFSKYGQVADLETKDLSLRVEYREAITEKIYNHYLCYLKRVVISRGNIRTM